MDDTPQGDAPPVTQQTAGPNPGKPPLTLPPIFDRMQRFTAARHVRAVKIEKTTVADDGKTALHFQGAYFPPVHIDNFGALPDDEVNHYLVVEDDGQHHVVPAATFEQHFKPV